MTDTKAASPSVTERLSYYASQALVNGFITGLNRNDINSDANKQTYHQAEVSHAALFFVLTNKTFLTLITNDETAGDSILQELEVAILKDTISLAFGVLDNDTFNTNFRNHCKAASEKLLQACAMVGQRDDVTPISQLN